MTNSCIIQKWTLDAGFVYQTGYYFTAPVATSALFDSYENLNNARFSDFHRLNLGPTKLWTGGRKGNKHHQLNISLYNAYNRTNAFAIQLISVRENTIDPLTGVPTFLARYEIRTRSLLPLIPALVIVFVSNKLDFCYFDGKQQWRGKSKKALQSYSFLQFRHPNIDFACHSGANAALVRSLY